MKIAFQTLAMGFYPVRPRGNLDAETRERLFAWGAKKGFDGIELEDSWFKCSTMSDGELEMMTGQLRRAGLEAAAVKCGGRELYTPSIAAKNEELLMGGVRAAAILGSKIVSVSLPAPASIGGVPEVDRIGRKVSPGSSAQASEEAFVKTAAALRRVTEAAAKVGVQVSIEMHQNSIADNSQSTLRLHRMVNHPNIGVNPDIGNLVWTYMTPEEDWLDALQAMAPHANYWHMKNSLRVHIPELERTVFIRGPLWQGVIDYRYALTVMLRAGYTGYGLVEGGGGGDQPSYVEQSLLYVRKLLEEIEPSL